MRRKENGMNELEINTSTTYEREDIAQGTWVTKSTKQRRSSQGHGSTHILVYFILNGYSPRENRRRYWDFGRV
jgi:hypothetical protein